MSSAKSFLPRRHCHCATHWSLLAAALVLGFALAPMQARASGIPVADIPANMSLGMINNEMSSFHNDSNQRIDDTNKRLDKTNSKLDDANAKHDDTNKKLDRQHDDIKTSGNGKGSFKTGTADDNSSDFNALALTTQDLLAKKKENNYESDAKDFFGDDTTVNCNEKASDLILQNCKKLRNILGAQLKEIKSISQNLEARNKALQNSIMKAQFNTPGELQKKQYEVSVLQTIIANDQMRLQTALASYQAMRNLYETKYSEAKESRATGKNNDQQNAKLIGQQIAGVAAATGTFALTQKTLDSTWQPEIFKDRGSISNVLSRSQK